MVTIDLFGKEEGTLKFSAGQAIFTVGDAGDAMFAVVSGEVDLFVRDTLVETLGPGGVFGEMALLDLAPRIATAVAKTDCDLARIDQKRFKFLVQQTPNFALQMMRVIADRLRRMDSRL